jgi:small conductance mechanosensitive channel
MQNFNMHNVTDVATTWGLQAIGAIAIFVVGKYLAGFAIKILRKVLEKSKVDETLVNFLCNMSYALALVFIVIAALGQLGVQTTSIAAVIAAAGLAVGLALQGSLANLAAGVMIVALRPFKLKDSILTAGMTGTVVDINIVTTTLKTDEGKFVIIPNAKITGDIIVNNSMQ